MVGPLLRKTISSSLSKITKFKIHYPLLRKPTKLSLCLATPQVNLETLALLPKPFEIGILALEPNHHASFFPSPYAPSTYQISPFFYFFPLIFFVFLIERDFLFY